MKYYKAFIIFLISMSSLFAQTPVEDEIGIWYTMAGNFRVSDKISISNCIQSWQYDIPDNFNLLIINATLNYHISPKLTTSVSYGFLDIDNGFEKTGTHTYENRFFEQIGYKHKLVKLPFDHRLRLEQRILNKATPIDNVLHNRFRYRIGTKIKLNNTLFIRLHNEYIWTVQTKKNNGFDENRLYGALGVNIFKAANIQIGYLNRKIKGLDLHRLQLGIYYKIDFRKNKS
ncbi:DUF2490 domain-containing protein [Seonamhaeicola sp. MEBiC1930]|uniref:DUF2490 domain-containing protein n=1 Tax=Seonamhaeicola sp. MEBiC01930 TaxID=2976768 RepID=UPI00324AE835